MFQKISDKDLRSSLRSLVAKDRETLMLVVDHLREVEDRGLHTAWGYSSLWDFAQRELLLTDSVAFIRITLARLTRKRPEIRPLIVEGKLGQCAACALMEISDAPDFAEILAKVRGMSKRELQDYLASRRNAPTPKRDTIRRIAASNLPLPLDADVSSVKIDVTPDTHHVQKTGEVESSALPKRKTHSVTFAASDEVVAKLKRAQDLEGSKELASIIEKALDAYLEKKDPIRRDAKRKEKAAKKCQPATLIVEVREKSQNAEPRRPNIALRDATYVEDEAQCSFVSPDGIRCNSKRHLQVDHIKPWALGGSSSDPDNFRILCAAHNLMFARRTFKPNMAPRHAS